jgi:phosphoglycolate phosphatase (TIGR01487 family)
LKKFKVFAVDIDGTLTENGGGAINLAALSKLRHLERLGYNVIYVTGRSSIEAYVLAVFGGTTRIAVGENGGAITLAPQEHKLLANKDKCVEGFEILRKNLDGVQIKPVFPRLTEVVMMRTFYLSDSKYAYHINEKGMDKAFGLKEALKIIKAEPEEAIAIGDSETDIPMYDICGCSIALGHAEDDVKARATHVVRGREGAGLVEAIDLVGLNYLGVKSS